MDALQQSCIYLEEANSALKKLAPKFHKLHKEKDEYHRLYALSLTTTQTLKYRLRRLDYVIDKLMDEKQKLSAENEKLKQENEKLHFLLNKHVDSSLNMVDINDDIWNFTEIDDDDEFKREIYHHIGFCNHCKK